MDYAPNPITFGEPPPGGVMINVPYDDPEAPAPLGSYLNWVLLGRQ